MTRRCFNVTHLKACEQPVNRGLSWPGAAGAVNTVILSCLSALT